MKSVIFRYSQLLDAVKIRIRQAQVKATLSANAEMILMYWDIGRIIAERQKSEGWGAGVIPRLSKDIRNELPEVKGFSERNIGYMMRFAREYSMPLILQQPVAKISSEVRLESKIVVPLHEKDIMKNLQRLVAKIPWGHNILLMQKIKDLPTRLWYIRQAINISHPEKIDHLDVDWDSTSEGTQSGRCNAYAACDVVNSISEKYREN